jgi:hypothetical protein
MVPPVSLPTVGTAVRFHAGGIERAGMVIGQLTIPRARVLIMTTDGSGIHAVLPDAIVAS